MQIPVACTSSIPLSVTGQVVNGDSRDWLLAARVLWKRGLSAALEEYLGLCLMSTGSRDGTIKPWAWALTDWGDFIANLFSSIAKTKYYKEPPPTQYFSEHKNMPWVDSPHCRGNLRMRIFENAVSLLPGTESKTKTVKKIGYCRKVDGC